VIPHLACWVLLTAFSFTFTVFICPSVHLSFLSEEKLLLVMNS